MLHPSVITFLKVADCGSFSAASEQLYLSKVSVMNQINTLEKHLGVSLFERTHQGVSLTAAGKLLYKNASKLMRMSEETIRELRQIGGADSRAIRVGTSIMRPCTSLVRLWETIDSDHREFQFSIVPFNDDRDSLNAMLSSLGERIDCFVTPCGSKELLTNYSFLPIGTCKCAIALSRKHPLAKKQTLTWEDLERETLLLMKRGDSYVIDEMREDILRNHRQISIVDFDGYYDISTFNLCEQQGYLMETLELWADLHPSLVTIPVDWQYEIPYGILYAKNPVEHVKEFVQAISRANEV